MREPVEQILRIVIILLVCAVCLFFGYALGTHDMKQAALKLCAEAR